MFLTQASHLQEDRQPQVSLFIPRIPREVSLLNPSKIDPNWKQTLASGTDLRLSRNDLLCPPH